MQILLSIFLGSDSDVTQFAKAFALLEEWGLPHRLHILSAHRTSAELEKALEQDIKDGAKVFIAGAGMAAHLPGVVASKTVLPVIGVPLVSGPLQGMDALYSIVQMPPGIPVATVAIGSAGALNSVLLAAQIIGGIWLESVALYRNNRAKEVIHKEEIAQKQGYRAFLS